MTPLQAHYQPFQMCPENQGRTRIGFVLDAHDLSFRFDLQSEPGGQLIPSLPAKALHEQDQVPLGRSFERFQDLEDFAASLWRREKTASLEALVDLDLGATLQASVAGLLEELAAGSPG